MPTCNCGNTYPKKRADLGYTTCTECGEREAQAESDHRRTCVMPMHKSGFTYVTSVQQARDITNMRRGEG